MKFDPTTKESIFKLKDGRTIYKTHNGFKYWVQSPGKESTEVTAKYYKTIKDNAIKNKNIIDDEPEKNKK